MDKYGFIVDGTLAYTFNYSDNVQEDMNNFKEKGKEVIWVKLLASTED